MLCIPPRGHVLENRSEHRLRYLLGLVRVSEPTLGQGVDTPAVPLDQFRPGLTVTSGSLCNETRQFISLTLGGSALLIVEFSPGDVLVHS